jgi:hypothetical protein
VDTQAYNDNKRFLQNVATFLIETSLQTASAYELHLLTALKVSPETFIAVQSDITLKTRLTYTVQQKLVEVIPKTIQPVRLIRNQLNQVKSELDNNITLIKNTRIERGGFLTFFVDLFTSENKKLKTLEQQQKQIQETLNTCEQVIKEFNIDVETLHTTALTTDTVETIKKSLKTLLISSTHKKHAIDYIENVKNNIINNLSRLSQLKANSELIAQFNLLSSIENQEAQNAKKTISKIISETLNKLNLSNDKLQYIELLKLFNLERFDILLHQTIQNEHIKIKKFQLIEQGWKHLLNDQALNKLSDSDINHFIGAVLWLDQSLIDVRNPLVELLQNASDQKVLFINETKEALQKLERILLDDFTNLAKPLTDEIKTATSHRLKFFTDANSRYTKQLGKTREKLIKNITQTLTNIDIPTKDTIAYLNNLEAVLSPDFIINTNLANVILDTKKRILKENLNTEQQRLFSQYETEIKFLKTGELSLWEKIQSKFKDNDPNALVEENLSKWKASFLNNLIGELRLSVHLNSYSGPRENNEEKIAIKLYLDSLIVETQQSIASSAIQELHWLTDMQTRRARRRLDSLFGLKLMIRTLCNHLCGIILL